MLSRITMKNVYLLTVLCLQNSLCTIDIGIPEYQHLAQRLTPTECRRLYISLHFTTFDPPPATEQNVPNATCFQLLTNWDKGSNKWEGKSKSHIDVVRRLRQIGRLDLAEWLSEAVLTKLVADVDDDLNTNFSNQTEVEDVVELKKEEKDWTMYDASLWAIIASLVITIVILSGRIISVCFKKGMSKKKVKEEEIMELLTYGALDSDQETIYECGRNTNRVGGSSKLDD